MKSQRSVEQTFENDICIHIFTVSAAMVGVCLTVIGLWRVLIQQKISSFADDLLAIDALIFLSSCILSYIALRKRGQERKHALEKVADGLFLTGLSCMVCVCLLVTYALV